MFELDHIFVLCEPGAPEADELLAAGFVEGQGYVHRGQGTANRVFFFQDFYLEFLWVHDEAEARSSVTGPTQLWERWSQRQHGASPFGLCLRPSHKQFAAQKPFAGFEYRPTYFPENASIWLAQQTISTPLMFYLSFVTPPNQCMPPTVLNPQQSWAVRLLNDISMISMADWRKVLELPRAPNEKMILELSKAGKHQLQLASLPLEIRY